MERVKQLRKRILMSFIIYLIMLMATRSLLDNKTVALVLILIYTSILGILAKKWGREGHELLNQEKNNNNNDERNNIHFGN